MSVESRAFLAADDAWANELRRLFGKDARNVRYTKKGEGEPGTRLFFLYAARGAAEDAYAAHMNKERQ